MLLLHGSKDIQVTTADLKRHDCGGARRAHRSLQYGELDGDNHLFQVLAAGGPSTGAEYQEARPAGSTRVIAAIVAWLSETR